MVVVKMVVKRRGDVSSGGNIYAWESYESKDSIRQPVNAHFSIHVWSLFAFSDLNQTLPNPRKSDVLVTPVDQSIRTTDNPKLSNNSLNQYVY